MKLLITLLALPLLSCVHATPPAPATTAYPSAYTGLLAKYATPEGVRYTAWHSNQTDLDLLSDVTTFYATTSTPTDSTTALAWHLNAYNAWILHNILAKYPTEGPLKGEPLFFHRKRIVISGNKTSFDHLEQKVIRPTFQEPRIHFALNCASKSCPPLLPRPFDPTTLDADLDLLATNFINNNPQGVAEKNEQTTSVSKLFHWYAEDFGGKNNIVTFLNRFRDTPLPPDTKLEFIDYSWQLNAAP